MSNDKTFEELQKLAEKVLETVEPATDTLQRKQVRREVKETFRNQPLTKEAVEKVLIGEIHSHTHPSSLEETFETVSKNLKTFPYQIFMDGIYLDYIVYDLGNGSSITKNFYYDYDAGVPSRVVLSGDVPSGIPLTKTFFYGTYYLTHVSYS